MWRLLLKIHWKILYSLKVSLFVALYKPFSFVSNLHYISNCLTSEIPYKTSRNVQKCRRMTRQWCVQNVMKFRLELIEESAKFIYPGYWILCESDLKTSRTSCRMCRVVSLSAWSTMLVKESWRATSKAWRTSACDVMASIFQPRRRTEDRRASCWRSLDPDRQLTVLEKEKQRTWTTLRPLSPTYCRTAVIGVWNNGVKYNSVPFMILLLEVHYWLIRICVVCQKVCNKQLIVKHDIRILH